MAWRHRHRSCIAAVSAAAFGIGIDDLDRLAVHRSHDIAGPWARGAGAFSTQPEPQRVCLIAGRSWAIARRRRSWLRRRYVDALILHAVRGFDGIPPVSRR